MANINPSYFLWPSNAVETIRSENRNDSRTTYIPTFTTIDISTISSPVYRGALSSMSFRGREQYTRISPKIYWQRRDAKVSNNPHQRRNNRHKVEHINNIITDFANLSSIYPMENIIPRGYALFGFTGDKYYNVLYIENIPSLVFISQRDGGIHLAEILPSNNRNRVEKFKRLFLRHLGFNCVRYDNKLRIQYTDGTTILVKPTEKYKFSKFTEAYSLIGFYHKPLSTMITETWKL